MPNDEMKDDLRTQWQSQPPEGERMSLEEVRAQAVQFQKRLRKRNIREYSAMVLAIGMAIPLGVFLRAFPLILVAMGLVIAGTLVIAYQFSKRSLADAGTGRDRLAGATALDGLGGLECGLDRGLDVGADRGGRERARGRWSARRPRRPRPGPARGRRPARRGRAR